MAQCALAAGLRDAVQLQAAMHKDGVVDDEDGGVGGQVERHAAPARRKQDGARHAQVGVPGVLLQGLPMCVVVVVAAAALVKH